MEDSCILLDEAIFRNQILKCLLRDIMVVDAVFLARPRSSCSMRHGKGKGFGFSREQKVDQGSLANTRGAGDDEGTAVDRKITSCGSSVGSQYTGSYNVLGAILRVENGRQKRNR